MKTVVEMIDNSISNVPRGPDGFVQFKDIVHHYKFKKSVRNQKGGQMKDMKAFAEKLVGSRLLNLYLKYVGITALTPSTLVPMSLLLGVSAFRKSLNEMIDLDGKGGFLPTRLPIIDETVVGPALMLSGLANISFTPMTLIPLGAAVALYEAFFNKSSDQKGGFRENHETYQEDGEDEDVMGMTFEKLLEQGGKLDKAEQTGGGVSDFASSQYSRGPINAPDMDVNTFRAFTETGEYIPNSELDGGTSADFEQTEFGGWEPLYISNPSTTSEPVGVSGNEGLSTNNFQTGGSASDFVSTQYSRGPVNTPGMTESEFRTFSKTAEYIPNSELDGGTSADFEPTEFGGWQPSYKSSPGPDVPSGVESEGTSTSDFQSGGKRKRRTLAQLRKLRNQKGGGEASSGGASDYASTLYSRGPINNPDMEMGQFRSFTQTSEYIPNSQLDNETSVGFQESEFAGWQPSYMDQPTANELLDVGETVATSNFQSGGKRRGNLNYLKQKYLKRK